MENEEFYSHLIGEQQNLKIKIDELTTTLKAIEQLIPHYSTMGSRPQKNLTTTITNFDIENKSASKKEYKVGDRVTDKVVEALSLLETATANEVGDTLSELYPDQFDIDKARTASKVTLSKLKADNKVNAEKVDGKNQFIYSIIKEKPPVEGQEDNMPV